MNQNSAPIVAHKLPYIDFPMGNMDVINAIQYGERNTKSFRKVVKMVKLNKTINGKRFQFAGYRTTKKEAEQLANKLRTFNKFVRIFKNEKEDFDIYLIYMSKK